jgi:hypothetical protein
MIRFPLFDFTRHFVRTSVRIPLSCWGVMRAGDYRCTVYSQRLKHDCSDIAYFVAIRTGLEPMGDNMIWRVGIAPSMGALLKFLGGTVEAWYSNLYGEFSASAPQLTGRKRVRLTRNSIIRAFTRFGASFEDAKNLFAGDMPSFVTRALHLQDTTVIDEPPAERVVTQRSMDFRFLERGA